MNLSNREVGVMLSGGADSAMLLYLVLKDNTYKSLKVFTVENKRDKSFYHSDGIIEWLEEYFNTTIDHEKIEVEHLTYVHENIKNVHTELLLWAQTQFPEEAKNWKHYDQMCFRFPSNKQDENYPFISKTKDQIIKMYKDNDIMDLFELTHSCIAQDYDHCGNCLWCEEREWALNANLD